MNVPICGLSLAVVEPSPTVPGVPPPGCVAPCTDPNSIYVTTISSPPVTTEQAGTCTIVKERYAHAVIVVFIPEDENQSCDSVVMTGYAMYGTRMGGIKIEGGSGPRNLP
jgi:hypothetical protein